MPLLKVAIWSKKLQMAESNQQDQTAIKMVTGHQDAPFMFQTFTCSIQDPPHQYVHMSEPSMQPKSLLVLPFLSAIAAEEVPMLLPPFSAAKACQCKTASMARRTECLQVQLACSFYQESTSTAPADIQRPVEVNKLTARKPNQHLF